MIFSSKILYSLLIHGAAYILSYDLLRLPPKRDEEIKTDAIVKVLMLEGSDAPEGANSIIYNEVLPLIEFPEDYGLYSKFLMERFNNQITFYFDPQITNFHEFMSWLNSQKGQLLYVNGRRLVPNTKSAKKLIKQAYGILSILKPLEIEIVPVHGSWADKSSGGRKTIYLSGELYKPPVFQTKKSFKSTFNKKDRYCKKQMLLMEHYGIYVPEFSTQGLSVMNHDMMEDTMVYINKKKENLRTSLTQMARDRRLNIQTVALSEEQIQELGDFVRGSLQSKAKKRTSVVAGFYNTANMRPLGSKKPRYMKRSEEIHYIDLMKDVTLIYKFRNPYYLMEKYNLGYRPIDLVRITFTLLPTGGFAFHSTMIYENGEFVVDFSMHDIIAFEIWECLKLQRPREYYDKLREWLAQRRMAKGVCFYIQRKIKLENSSHGFGYPVSSHSSKSKMRLNLVLRKLKGPLSEDFHKSKGPKLKYNSNYSKFPFRAFLNRGVLCIDVHSEDGEEPMV